MSLLENLFDFIVVIQDEFLVSFSIGFHDSSSFSSVFESLFNILFFCQFNGLLQHLGNSIHSVVLAVSKSLNCNIAGDLSGFLHISTLILIVNLSCLAIWITLCLSCWAWFFEEKEECTKSKCTDCSDAYSNFVFFDFLDDLA